LGARTHKVSAPKDLLEVIARSTACSSIVFSGLLAWASLDAHRRCHLPARGYEATREAAMPAFAQKLAAGKTGFA
jgi:hypothetical protein